MPSQIWVNPYLGNYTPMCIIISKCGHLYFPLSPHASSPRHSPHFPSPHFSSQLTKHPLGLTSPHPTFTSPHLQIPSLYNHLPITLDFHHPIFPSPYFPSPHFSSQLTKHPLGLTSPHPTFTSPLTLQSSSHHLGFPSPHLHLALLTLIPPSPHLMTTFPSLTLT